MSFSILSQSIVITLRWSIEVSISYSCKPEYGVDTAGWLDAVSDAGINFPETYIFLKRHANVRWLRQKILALVISSNDQSPNILTNGLWSVATIKSSHPSAKFFLSSKVQATAKASPSIGTYRCSAALRNQEPASVIFHPESQQSGVSDSQLQYFCRNQYPMPVFDQSVLKQVFHFSSKIFTPSWISWINFSLELLNALSNSFVYTNMFLD